MPDDYGNFKGIAVPQLPWLQTFHTHQRVRVTATQQLGYVCWQDDRDVYLDLGDGEPIEMFPAGELRPA